MISSKYKKTYHLTFNDFDRFENLYPSSILNLFQDVGGDHASKMNIGFTDLIKENLIWALLRIKYEVIKKPYVYQEVVVETWPIPVQRFIYQREFKIYDLSGNLLIKASTLWTILDIEKRQIAPIKDIYSLKLEDYFLETSFTEKIKRLKTPEFDREVIKYRCEYTDLDFNNHLNNSKYANYILNSLNPVSPLEILTFQIDYHKEVVYGESLYLRNKIEGNTIKTFALNDNDELIFVSEITYK